MIRVVVSVLLICSTAVLASGAAPSFVAARLDVKRSPSDEVSVALNRHLRILLMKEPRGVTPTPSMWDAAITEHKRQDCDQNDDCLRGLAVLAGTVYAVYAAVELDLTRTSVTAIGRIVRRDGVLVEVGGQRGFQVVLPMLQRPFNLVAAAALTELVTQMKLSELPATLPANGVEAQKPSPPEVKPVEPPAAVVAPPQPGAGPLAGKVLLGAGGAVMVAGGVVALVGQIQAGTLTPVDGNLPPSQLGAWRAAVTLRPVGVTMLGVGAAAATAGALLWLLAPGAPVQAALVPQHGGATFAVTGVFP